MYFCERYQLFSNDLYNVESSYRKKNAFRNKYGVKYTKYMEQRIIVNIVPNNA